MKMKKILSLIKVVIVLVTISGCTCQSDLKQAYESAAEERKQIVLEEKEETTPKEYRETIQKVVETEETTPKEYGETIQKVVETEETTPKEYGETIQKVVETEETTPKEYGETIQKVVETEEVEEEVTIPEEGLELRPFGFIGAEKMRVRLTKKECWLWEGSVARLVATGDFETAKVVRDEKDPDYEGVLVNFDTEIEIYEHNVNWIIFKSVINGSYVDIRNQHMKIFDEEGTYWEGAGIKKTKLHREDLVEVWTNRPETVRDYSGLRWVKLYEAEGIEKGAGIRTKEVG